jgi:hypothetical protein
MKVICAQCGTEFNTTPYKVNVGEGKYCSHSCAGKARGKQLKTNCVKCGTEFKTRESRVKKGRGKYCSRSCAGTAKGKVVKNCLKCGIEFKTRQSRVKKGWSKYCSQACFGKANKKQVKTNCLKCGSQFNVRECRVKRGGGKYCSIACAGKVKVSKLELMDDLRRVAHQLGHRPTQIEYSQHGKFSATLIGKVGGLRVLWESMGLLYKDKNSIAATGASSVLADLQRLRKQLGHLPSSQEYDQFGHHDYKTVLKYLQVNSWYEALIKAFHLSGPEAARVTPPKHRTLEMWLELLRNLAQELGRVPSHAEARTRISWESYRCPILQGKSFKSFLEAAGLDARKCVAQLITDEELIADVIRVAKQIRRVPSHALYNKHGGYSPGTVARYIGWRNAQEIAAQAIELRPVNQPVKELSKVADPLRDKLKESSVEAIKGFFQAR